MKSNTITVGNITYLDQADKTITEAWLASTPVKQTIEQLEEVGYQAKPKAVSLRYAMLSINQERNAA